MAGLPEAAKGPAFAVAAGLLVYPQAAHLEHFEPRRTRHLMTGTRLHRAGRTMASGELLMTRTQIHFASPDFIHRPEADRHDMAASQNARPSKRQP